MTTTQDTTATLNLSVSSKLMKNYESGSPVSHDQEIATARDKSGNLMFFSIGSDGHLYFYAKDSGSTTGWNRVDLSVELGQQIKTMHIATAQDVDGSPILAAVFQDPANPSNVLLYHTRDFSDQPASSRWVSRGTMPGVEVTHIATGAGKAGDVLIVISTQQGNQATCYMINPDPKGTWLWKEVPVPIQSKGVFGIAIGHNQRIERIQTVEALLYTLLQVDDNTSALIVTSLPNFNFYNHQIPLNDHPTAIGTISDASGDTELFAGSTTLYQLNGALQLSQNADQVNSGKVNIGTQSFVHNIKTVVNGRNSAGQLEAWILTEDGFLYFAQQQADNTWTEPFALENEVGQLTALRNDQDDSIDIFTVDLNDQLHHLWQDQVTSRWKDQQIVLAETDTTVEFDSYATQITLTNQDGTPASDQQCTIRASELSMLAVNGSKYFVDQSSDSVVSATDDNGQITITNKAQGLASPVIRLEADFLGGVVDINPAAGVKNKLSSLSADDIKNATMQTTKDGATEPLFQNQSGLDLDGTSQAISQLVGLHDQLPSSNGGDGTAQVNVTGDGAIPREAGASFSNQLNVDSLPADYYWGLDLTGDHPAYSDNQTHIQNNFLQTYNAKLSAAPPAPQTSAVGGVEGVWEDIEHAFGDAWEAVKQGFIDVTHLVVQKIEEGIQIIINGLEDAFHVVVRYAEQVWDVIEYVFQKVGVFFEDLVRWLGFIFNWDDILVTHKVFVDAANSMFDLGEQEISVLEGHINAWCDHAEQELSDLQPFPSHIGDASSQDTANNAVADAKSGSAGSSFSSVPDFIASDPAANWGNNQIRHTDMVGGTQGGQTSAGDQLIQAVTRFVEETLTSEISNIETTISQLADDMKLAFENNTLTPNQIVAQIAGDVLKGLIEAMRRLLIGLLELTKDLLEWLEDVINEPIHIPLLTPLYENIIAPGSKLTLLDGISLLVAIPVTIVYKLIAEKVPFQEGDSAPLPAVSLPPVTQTAQLAKSSQHVSRMAAAAPLTAEVSGNSDSGSSDSGSSDSGPSHDHSGLTKTLSYVSGIWYSVDGFIATGIDAYEYFKVTQVEADPEQSSLIGDDLEDRKANVRLFRLVNRVVNLPCLFPLDTDDKIYPYQWVIFGLGGGAIIKDMVFVAKGEDNEKVISVTDAAFAVITMVFEAVIFGIDISEDDEYGDADKGMKLAQYILLTLGEVLGVPATFVEDIKAKAVLVGVSAGSSTIGNVMNIVRMGINIHEDRIHNNS